MVNLLNMDCMDLMANHSDNYFDLAIVDPPYGIGMDLQYNNGIRKTNYKKKQWNDSIPSQEYFIELHRVSKHQIIWGCNYYAKYIPSVGRIIHDKKIRTNGTKLGFSECDIASCSKQKRITIYEYTWSGNKQGKVVNWDNSGIDARIHPAQKPISLYEWLLINYADKGDKILDTHLGSGSIAIACYNYNFDLVGCEIDKDYYDQMILRYNNHISQQRLVFNENAL